jgi:hypothetical protein
VKTIHDQRSQETVHHVHENFFKCKMDDSDTIASFVAKLESLRGQLLNLGDATITQQTKMAKILSQLPKQFEPFQSAWENVKDAQKNLTVMRVRLLRAEVA